jgi:predicted house-cleaning noncanonical NTP pyrophosphatase (MazG superfamily)
MPAFAIRAKATRWEIYWPGNDSAPTDTIAEKIGRKALGLIRIPSPWRPPFFVLPAGVFQAWREQDAGNRAATLQDATAKILDACTRFGPEWSAGVMLRSSAVNETLLDRGAYESKALPADYDAAAIHRALSGIFKHFEQSNSSSAIAIVIQPFVPGPNRFLGHMSNERRVSKTINQWMAEAPQGDWSRRFNSQRANSANPTSALMATGTKQLLCAFRSVGRWCTGLGNGPAHLEWAWSNQRLWLLQLDFEDECPDDGIDPNKLIRNIDSTQIVVADTIPLTTIDQDAPDTNWRKIDKIKSLAAVRSDPYPKLYCLTGSELRLALDDEDNLRKIIQEVSNGRVVCRTDCNAEEVEELNLPRTHSVTPLQAVAFMKETLKTLVAKGAKESEVCFILHRFIPATASAWALADPESQIVRVDSLWGIPDGLQFLPHDTFEYDVRRRNVSSETIRYKVAFIQETESGAWKELTVGRRFGRSKSLSASDVREVGAQTYEIAKQAGKRIQVMWFCNVPVTVGIGRNLPWFALEAPSVEVSKRKSAGPSRARFVIRTRDDLESAGSLARDRHVLALHPDVDLIRSDDKFLRELSQIAIAINAPVELQGSILGHAYYMLNRAGVTVIATGESSRSRVRGKQIFGKLVRDFVPDHIKQHGETTVLAKIPKEDVRASLLVKLLEEAHELLRAENPEEVLAELADLFEVVRSLAIATGVSWDDVLKEADKKREKRGGFEKGTLLMETGWPKGPESASPEPRTLPLRALAVKSESGDGAELNYAALIAKGADRTFRFADGTLYEVTLTKSGVRLRRVEHGSDTNQQFSLPGLDDL